MAVPSHFVVNPHPRRFLHPSALFSFSSLRAVAIIILSAYSVLLNIHHVRREIDRFKPS